MVRKRKALIPEKTLLYKVSNTWQGECCAKVSHKQLHLDRHTLTPSLCMIFALTRWGCWGVDIKHVVRDCWWKYWRGAPPGRVSGCPGPGWQQGGREHQTPLSPRSQRTRQGESVRMLSWVLKKDRFNYNLGQLDIFWYLDISNLGVCFCYIGVHNVFSVPRINKPEEKGWSCHFLVRGENMRRKKPASQFIHTCGEDLKPEELWKVLMDGMCAFNSFLFYLSWLLEKVDSRILISAFRTFRHAILSFSLPAQNLSYWDIWGGKWCCSKLT